MIVDILLWIIAGLLVIGLVSLAVGDRDDKNED